MDLRTLLLACLVPTLATGAPSALEPTPQAAIVTKADLTPVFRYKGSVKSAEAIEFHLRPRAFQGPWRVVNATAPGPVQAGTIALKFDTSPIEREIRDARTHLQEMEARKLSLETNARLLEIQAEVEEVQSLADLKRAEEDLKAYIEYDAKLELPRLELDKKQSDFSLSVQEEELRQLDDMYRKNELAESTKDYVIERERKHLEFYKERLKFEEAALARRKALDIPRARQDLEERVTSLKLGEKLRTARNASSKADMALHLVQLLSELNRSKEFLEDLESDLESHTVLIQADGILATSWNPGDEIQSGSLLATLHKGGGILVEVVADEPLSLDDIQETTVRHDGGVTKATPLSVVWQPDEGGGQKWLVSLKLGAALPLGTPVSVKITGQPHSGVLTLERSSLAWADDRVTARRILPDKTTEVVEVSVGASDGEKVEIVEGLLEGDRVEKTGD
ncbi:MAG: hypothetical protein AB7F75_03190 [Planctomycetota bacterium]